MKLTNKLVTNRIPYTLMIARVYRMLSEIYPHCLTNKKTAMLVYNIIETFRDSDYETD